MSLTNVFQIRCPHPLTQSFHLMCIILSFIYTYYLHILFLSIQKDVCFLLVALTLCASFVAQIWTGKKTGGFTCGLTIFIENILIIELAGWYIAAPCIEVICLYQLIHRYTDNNALTVLCASFVAQIWTGKKTGGFTCGLTIFIENILIIELAGWYIAAPCIEVICLYQLIHRYTDNNALTVLCAILSYKEFADVSFDRIRGILEKLTRYDEEYEITWHDISMKVIWWLLKARCYIDLTSKCVRLIIVMGSVKAMVCILCFELMVKCAYACYVPDNRSLIIIYCIFVTSLFNNMQRIPRYSMCMLDIGLSCIYMCVGIAIGSFSYTWYIIQISLMIIQYLLDKTSPAIHELLCLLEEMEGANDAANSVNTTEVTERSNVVS
eukprot:996658_1